MTTSSSEHKSNRLANETSPYLLQHAQNPVDWFPWGEEALAKAKSEDKPIFLSVGYSACHWCHVMERESFENPALAELMNDRFVNIKVDREERPDIDQIYMNAVQAMTGRGGWPMSVFLTPEGKPFFGGTYYPPEDRHGMPGFRRVILSVDQAWKNRHEEILDSAGEMTTHLADLAKIPDHDSSLELGIELLDSAAAALRRQFDPVHGGFGQSPKFPHPMDLRLLLRVGARAGDAHAIHMVRHTLDKMARGGIYDHLGGGFARYSTDAKWLVPHFEKMLYDNVLLALTYTEAWQLTGEEDFARVTRETLNYLLSRMTDPVDGGFYATEDADSEGEEGKYYVWDRTEVVSLLGTERAERFCRIYDVSPHGNWEGQNILNLLKPLEQVATADGVNLDDLRRELEEDRTRILAARQRRIPPGKDTKILTSWNGLALAAFASAAWALNEPGYLQAATRCAAFIRRRMITPGGLLLHSFKDGQARFNGYLDDYANVIDGLVRLFEAGGDRQWLAF
ncbi:MAG: thioredoxin domain-containing protein, partial [bacterium]